ncbi:unnamed protein product [Cercospora beticola]|nr:unnamed protein product [Cercospora beticola]
MLKNFSSALLLFEPQLTCPQTRPPIITTCGQAGAWSAPTTIAVTNKLGDESCKLECDGTDGCEGVMVKNLVEPPLPNIVVPVQCTLYRGEVTEQGLDVQRIYGEVCWAPKV